MIRLLFISLFTVVFAYNLFSQCSVVVASTNGYSVNIRISLTSVIPSSTNCPNGYNYNVALAYTVAFTGSNIPSSLYTLQGNFTCNSQNLFYDLPNSAAVGTTTTTSNPYIASNGTNLYTTHPSCTAANTTNLNCTGVTIDINGPGINNQTVNCNVSSPLPIGLSYFLGAYVKQGIQLKWQTSTETNNYPFTVERSHDGVEWLPLGTIPGAGTSLLQKTYALTDEDPLNGINYYRLKQTDFDLKVTYSPVISLLNTTHNIYFSELWPNPTSDVVNFEITGPSDGRADYTMTSEFGASVKRGELAFYKGKNEMSMSLADLQPGYYVLQVDFTDGTKVYKKIVKL